MTQELTIRINADGSLVVAESKKVVDALGGIGGSAVNATSSLKSLSEMSLVLGSAIDSMGGYSGIAAKALATLGVSASIGWAKDIVMGSINSAAAIHDLAIKTGVTAEALSGLAAVGKYSEQTADSIATAMNRMTRALNGVTEEGKGAGFALDALGLTTKEFIKQSPDQQMITLAKTLDTFQDGAGKSAVAMALLGKNGADMLPMLKDLAVAGDISAKVTTEQADAADNFTDNLTKLRATHDAWKRELSMAIVPALDLATQAYVDIMNGTNGVRQEIEKLSKDGTITHWANTAIIALSYVLDGVQILTRTFHGLIATLGTVALGAYEIASGNFSKAGKIFSEGWTEVTTVFDDKMLGQRLRDRMGEIKALGKAAEDAKPILDASKLGTTMAGSGMSDAEKLAQRQAKSYGELISAIQEKIDAAKQEASQDVALSESQKQAIAIEKMVKDGKISAKDASSALVQAKLAEMASGQGLAESHKAELKMLDELAKDADKINARADAQVAANTVLSKGKTAIEEMTLATLKNQMAEAQGSDRFTPKYIANLELKIKAQERYVESLNGADFKALDKGLEEWLRTSKDSAALYEDEARLASMTSTERAVIVEQRKVELKLAQEIAKVDQSTLSEADKEVLRQKARDAALIAGSAATSKVVQDAWVKASDQINQSLTDALMRGFESGKGFLQNLGDAAVNLFKTLVLRPQIQGMVTGFTGALGLTPGGAAAGQSGLGGMAGSAVNLLGLGGAGAAFTGGMGAGFSDLLGEAGFSGAMSAGSVAIGAGNIMGGLGTLVGALGPIALGIGAIATLASSLDHSGTYHTGGSAQYNAESGVIDTTGKSAQYGTSAFDVKYSADTAGAAGNIAKTLVNVFDTTAVAFGKKAGFEAATAFADDSSSDGAWGALRISQGGKSLVDWQDTRTSRWAPKEFSDGAKGQAEYAAAIAASTRDALNKMGLPEWATQMLDSLGNAPTLEQLSAVVTNINATQTALTRMGATMPQLSGLSDSAVTGLLKLTGGITGLQSGLSTYYDKFYTDAEKQASATKSVSDQMAALGLTMPATNEEFRKLVEAQDLNTEAGRKQYASLIALAPAFDSVTSAAQKAAQAATQEAAAKAKAIADQAYSLQTQLLQAQGNTAALRERERAALDPANRAIYDQIKALEDQKAAADKAAAALQQASADQQQAAAAQQQAAQAAAQAAADYLASLKTSTDNAYAALQKSVQLERDAAAKLVQDRTTAVAAINSVFDLITSSVNSLMRATLQGGITSVADANSFIDRAVSTGRTGGALPDIKALQDAITVATGGVEKAVYTTKAEEDAARITLANRLSALKDAGAVQLSTAERQLAEAQAQTAKFDQLLETYKTQIDVMRGVDTSVKSVAVAIDGLTVAIALEKSRAGASAATGSATGAATGTAAGTSSAASSGTASASGGSGFVTGGGGTTDAAYAAMVAAKKQQDAAAKAALDAYKIDASSRLYQYAQDPSTIAHQYGETDAQALDRIKAMDMEEQQRAAARAAQAKAYPNAEIVVDNGNGNIQIVPKYANGGAYGGGLAMVGENGPELINFAQPGQVYNARQTQDILRGSGASDNTALVQELQQMRAELEGLRAEARANVMHSQRTAIIMDRITQGGDTLRTEVATS